MGKQPYVELRDKFFDPPFEYGPIDCWWWEAAVLDKKKMTLQLEDMKNKGIAGTWFYPRFVYGEPPGPDPPYWSEKWWEFFKWSMQEQRRLGMTAWFSDWTALEYFQNKVRDERVKNPELTGKRLTIHEAESKSTGPVSIEVPSEEAVLCAAAYKKLGDQLDDASKRDLKDAVHDGKLTWNAPEAGWLVAAVTVQPNDLDYLNRAVADRWLEVSLHAYEEHLPNFVGNTLKAYGPDEMYVLRGNILFSSSVLDRIKKERGYDPVPHLVGLFHDVGKMTDKIRCDYYDVMVSVLEENFYRPLAQWLHERGMLYTTIATWGREDILSQTYHYGDFFRMMRHFDVTGNEDPHLTEVGERRLIDAKLSSSVAHLYGRSRVAVCVYWGAGWGQSQEQNLAWTNENYAYGINLYNCHGVLYSTMGGWYEWVPPDVHFRQPYWQNWKAFTDYIRRLSYVMSQGRHAADVAILYPITTVHANWSQGGRFSSAADEAANTTLSLARVIYRNGVDFDFIDEQSLFQAEVSDAKIKVSGLEFPALLLPPMTTIRTETLRKIKEFYDAGGKVIAFRRLPNASPENGRDDQNICSLLREIFGTASSEEYHYEIPHGVVASSFSYRVLKNENVRGGKAFFVPSEENGMKARTSIPEIISSAVVQDVVASEKGIFHTHQKMEGLDIYFLFNTKPEKKRIEFTFRVRGEPEIWDAFTGETTPVHRFELLDGRTKVHLDVEPYQGLVVTFTPPSGRPAVLEDNLTAISKVEPQKSVVKVSGFTDTGGKKKVRIRYDGKEYVSEVRADSPPEPVFLDGDWRFQLQPTMDNSWGDFRYPPSPEYIGAEARRFKYMEEKEVPGTKLGWHKQEFNDSNWPVFTYSFGPYWWTIGPVPDGQEPPELLEEAIAGNVGPEKRYKIDEASLRWRWYCFSEKFGSEEKDVQHWTWEHGGGLIGVSENFIAFDATGKEKDVTRYLFTYVRSPEERGLTFNFGGKGVFPREAWINGKKVISVGLDEKIRKVEVKVRGLRLKEDLELESEVTAKVQLKKGLNRVLLKLVQPKGEKVWTYAVFYDPDNPPKEGRYVPLLRWFVKPSKISFDIMPDKTSHVGWYRFEAPPGVKAMKLKMKAQRIQSWVNGEPVEVHAGKIILPSPIEKVSQIALRIEHESGCYAGAAFSEPVIFECGRGIISLGDWCNYALEAYSGGAVYAKTVKLNAKQVNGRVLLDLGQVNSTAEVFVNGKSSGIRLGRPYLFDVTSLLRKGDNQVEVKVYNTLANHYSVGYPTNYVYKGQTVSGLLGPVKLQFLSEISLRGRKLQIERLTSRSLR